MNSEKIILKQLGTIVLKRNQQWYVNNLNTLNRIIDFCLKKKIAIIAIEAFKYYENNGIEPKDVQNYSIIASGQKVVVNKRDWNDYVSRTLYETAQYGKSVPFDKNILLELFLSSMLEWNFNNKGISNYQLWKKNIVPPIWD